VFLDSFFDSLQIDRGRVAHGLRPYPAPSIAPFPPILKPASPQYTRNSFFTASLPNSLRHVERRKLKRRQHASTPREEAGGCYGRSLQEQQ